MLEALGWGTFAAASLLVGAGIALAVRVPSRVIGLIMALGAGVLISAVAFELADEAFKRGGADALAVGLATGALAFFAADVAVARRGGRHRKRSDGRQNRDDSATGLVIGTLMDGIPESAAIGLTLVGGGKIGAPVVAAVFLSNLPEAMSATAGLQKGGRSARWILGLWTATALISGVAAAVGYVALDGASDNIIAGIQAFAGGAILTMLADTMMPEAASEPGNGPFLGVVTVLGFASAFLLSKLG
jgi:ZIP family zinc transporter